MNIKKCLQLLREIRDLAFATVDENGNPQYQPLPDWKWWSYA